MEGKLKKAGRGVSAGGYAVISRHEDATVVAEYVREAGVCEDWYESEERLERWLLDRLQQQGYEYVGVKCEADLVANLRCQLERLNGVVFTDGEWERFFASDIVLERGGVREKTNVLQRDYVRTLKRDNGESVNIYLLNKKDVHANVTQVINQYVPPCGVHGNRYDVTILVNGLPMVHLELKRRGVSIREAFNQIDRYGRESFWAGCGLFEFVQLFVVSNGTETKYYGNTTRLNHVAERAGGGVRRQGACNSFEFTIYWADGCNNIINDLRDFAATFLSRHTLLNVLTRYCVLTDDGRLLVMRPYQIAAAERIVGTVERGLLNGFGGKPEGGGYIWHTTGSGKTLTSFKTAQLCTELEGVDKVFFVVDRKDLDYQTMREYDRFMKGAANGNTSTAELISQIDSGEKKIIVTTIQKLSHFVSSRANRNHGIFSKRVVIIFDECHRSQFGRMHAEVVKRFKNYFLFGFTGTPIFGVNSDGVGTGVKTTAQVFGACLHQYTIVDAIRDGNVLPFYVSYHNTIKEKRDVEDCDVLDIDREQVLKDGRRIGLITKYILDNFDRYTKRSSGYKYKGVANVPEVVRARGKNKVDEVKVERMLRGFNSILAVQSIEFAKLYYDEFMRRMSDRPRNERLRIATIFTYSANEGSQEVDADENPDSVEGLDLSSREFLDRAIGDYNAMFGTQYSTDGELFGNYYKDVSHRMKNRELDLLIVVNMFLTGFDAPTLNTLWVDKNLRYHGLIQAFSRTNRILNSVKSAGNIVCFRNLDCWAQKAFALYGDREAGGVAVLRSFGDYMYGYDADGKHVDGYVEVVDKLREVAAPGELPFGEEAERRFIGLFGCVLRLRNLLSMYDEFAGGDVLSEREVQDYTGIYNDLHEEYHRRREVGGLGREDIRDDVEFEMELVRQVEVNIDYILFLVEMYHRDNCRDKEILARIERAVSSSPELRRKKVLIERFVEELRNDSPVDKQWFAFVNRCKLEEFDEIITGENLRRAEALAFIAESFRRGSVEEYGTEVDGILPPLNPFDPSQDRGGKKGRVLERIREFFARYYGIADDDFGVGDGVESDG